MPWIFILFYNIFFQPCRNYKREAELARMAWKVNPQDLLPTQFGAKGQFGSRFSLGRLSMPVMKKDVVLFIVLVLYTYKTLALFLSLLSKKSRKVPS